MLTPTLLCTSDALAKLERERYRARRAKKPIDAGDHIYNFCITALAVRDYAFSYSALSQESRQAFHDKWSRQPHLAACSEIANSSKHCTLRNAARTRGALLAEVDLADFVELPSGEATAIIRRLQPTIEIELANGEVINADELMTCIMGFMVGYLMASGIPVTQQSPDQLATP